MTNTTATTNRNSYLSVFNARYENGIPRSPEDWAVCLGPLTEEEAYCAIYKNIILKTLENWEIQHDAEEEDNIKRPSFTDLYLKDYSEKEPKKFLCTFSITSTCHESGDCYYYQLFHPSLSGYDENVASLSQKADAFQRHKKKRQMEFLRKNNFDVPFLCHLTLLAKARDAARRLIARRPSTNKVNPSISGRAQGIETDEMVKIQQQRREIETEATTNPLPEERKSNEHWTSRNDLAKEQTGGICIKTGTRRKYDRDKKRGAFVEKDGLSGWSCDGLYWKKHEIHGTVYYYRKTIAAPLELGKKSKNKR